MVLADIYSYHECFNLLQIRSKTLKEINDFYRCFKYTDQYKTWKAKQKDRPRPVADISDMIFQ